MNYPKDIKAFYMRVNDDGKTVAAMDVLAPGIGEIIGGSQREERLDVLDARMAERGNRQGALRLVPRPAPLRHRAARRLRPRLRAHARLRHRARQRARRDPVSAHAGECKVLIDPCHVNRQPGSNEPTSALAYTRVDLFTQFAEQDPPAPILAFQATFDWALRFGQSPARRDRVVLRGTFGRRRIIVAASNFFLASA